MTLETDRAELAAEKRAARQGRRAFTQSAAGQFVRIMQSAMNQYDAARAAGMSREDAVRGIEAELRGVWPMPTSKFTPACEVCDDTGYRLMTCWHEHRCQRQGPKSCALKHPAWEHAYVVPCDCQAGDRMRPRSPVASLESVGKTKRTFRKIGR